MKKRIVVFIFVFFLLGTNVYGAETGEDFLGEQYSLSGAEELNDALPENVREYIEKNGLSAEDFVGGRELSAQNVFSHIFGFLASGIKSPLSAAGAVLAVILVSGILEGAVPQGQVTVAVSYAITLSAAAIICAPILEVISAGVNAMKGCAVFMTAFVPVFGVIIASSGATVSSASMSGLLLAASQGVSWVSGFVVTPLLGGYLALSVASAVSPAAATNGIAEGVKKLAFWIMSLVTTLFVGILSLQTAINTSADTLASRTAKFILGSAVPVAGTVLSEALTTVTASMGILKASVGIYGVIGVSLIFLPLLAELVIWRICLMVNSCIAELFSVKALAGLLRGVDSVISVLCGMLLLTAAMFIISLSIIISAGGGM